MEQENQTLDNSTQETIDTSDVLNNKEVNQAAHEFGQAMKEIKTLSKAINRNGLARVFCAAVEFPLADKYTKFKKGSQEERLFILTLHALGSKQIMTNAFLSNAQTQQQVEEQVIDQMVEELTPKKEGEE